MDALVLKNGTMSSVEIAELTGKQHFHVMEAIRTMEPAWEKVSQSKFRLAEYLDAQGKSRPCYELNKTECLYIATKFNDEARAKLVLRWEELETEKLKTPTLSSAEIILQIAQFNVAQERRLSTVEQNLNTVIEEKKQSEFDLDYLPVSDAWDESSKKDFSYREYLPTFNTNGSPYALGFHIQKTLLQLWSGDTTV